MEITSHPFFENVAAEQMGFLASSASLKVYNEGNLLFDEGDPSDVLYLLLEGEVSFYKSLDDQEYRMVSSARDGAFFGEVGILTGEPRSLRAQARTQVAVAELPAKAVLKYFESIPGPIHNIITSIISHLHETTRHYVNDMLDEERMAIVGKMMNTIIHDFKNPFCLISMSAQIIGKDHPDEKTQRYCQSIEAQVRRMVMMAEELGEFSRGQQQLNVRPLSLRGVLEQFKDLNFPYFQQERICIQIDVPDMEIMGEENKLIRVFQNLVGNAIDAMEDNGGLIRIDVSAITRDDVIIRIQDNAGGIPESIRHNFFEPFVTMGKARGTGLGTAIAKSIVEAHGGEISFETETGKGTTFFVQLPLSDSD